MLGSIAESSSGEAGDHSFGTQGPDRVRATRAPGGHVRCQAPGEQRGEHAAKVTGSRSCSRRCSGTAYPVWPPAVSRGHIVSDRRPGRAVRCHCVGRGTNMWSRPHCNPDVMVIRCSSVISSFPPPLESACSREYVKARSFKLPSEPRSTAIPTSADVMLLVTDTRLCSVDVLSLLGQFELAASEVLSKLQLTIFHNQHAVDSVIFCTQKRVHQPHERTRIQVDTRQGCRFPSSST